MLFALSSDAIIDLIHAHAALELLSVSPDSEIRTLLTPILDREHPEPLELMVKSSFAQAALRLMPCVSDGSLSDPSMLRLDLNLPRSFPSSLVTALRRQLELAVAMDVLDAVVTVSLLPNLTVSATLAVEMAGRFRERRDEAMGSILSSLRTPCRPFVRHRGY